MSFIHRKSKRHHYGWLIILTGALLFSAYLYYRQTNNSAVVYAPNPQEAVELVRPGNVLSIVGTQAYNVTQTAALAHQNYGATTPAITTGITKYTFRYRSELPGGEDITIYGRAYLPDNPAKNLPVFAFATGTTGIGDVCAASLEQPAKVNWANYDSHMALYASQGFAAVVTDYEGMRDTQRIHHYMVGELEGRAVLDSIRALRRLPAAKGRLSASNVFLGGYSQGGHAAFWADKIAAQYAPDVRPKGVVGFGPVMSVKQTLADVTRGANINWFGPYVTYSYKDFYKQDYGSVLLPHWQQSLNVDVPVHCIDSDIRYWGRVPANVYTPDFLAALTSGQLSDKYAALERDLDRNGVGTVSTASAKRINQGALDNVVLASQQETAAPILCQSSTGPVQLMIYPATDHYNTMVHSLNDTLAWMHTLMSNQTVASTCAPESLAP